MIFVEPQRVYFERRTQQPSYERQVIHGPLANLMHENVRQSTGDKPRIRDDFWTELALKTVREHSDEPMAITALSNALAKWGNFSSRTAREEHKLKSFRLIGNLIRSGRLRRVYRKYVTLPQRASA